MMMMMMMIYTESKCYIRSERQNERRYIYTKKTFSLTSQQAIGMS